MAMQGAYIFTGYLPGKGMVRVFQDLDSTQFVFAQSMKDDSRSFVSRDVVQVRVVKNESAKVKEPQLIQPTLF